MVTHSSFEVHTIARSSLTTERGYNGSAKPWRALCPASKMEVVATSFAGAHVPATIPLHCVHVREVDAPEGAEPIEWRLWTNLPVDTPAQILYVVDVYRARWLIEEFFKALKTGCALEK